MQPSGRQSGMTDSAVFVLLFPPRLEWMSHTGTSRQSFSQSAMLCCQFIISKGISSRLLVPLVGHGRLVSGEGGDFCQRPFPSTSSHPSQLTSALLRHFGSKSGADKSLHGDSAICKSCCGRRVFSPPFSLRTQHPQLPPHPHSPLWLPLCSSDSLFTFFFPLHRLNAL